MGDLASLERRFTALLGLGTLSAMPRVLHAPAADEFAPFYAGYVARVADVAHPVDELSAQRMRLLNDFGALSEDSASYRYAEGKWNIKQVVGHLADAERILSYRLLRIARGDQTPLAGWDENLYAATAGVDEREFGDLLDDWAAARDSTIALVHGLPDAAWERRGSANGAAVTARALLYIILGHVEHHRAVLADRYGR